MVESRCPTCSSLVLPGQSFCAKCGTSLAGLAVPAPEPEPPLESESTTEAAPEIERYEGPLLVSPESDAEPAPHIPGGYVSPTPGLEPSAWVINPSNGGSMRPGSSIGIQVGARPMSLGGSEEQRRPEPPQTEPAVPTPPFQAVSTPPAPEAAPVAPAPVAPAPLPVAPIPQPSYAPPVSQQEPLPSFVVPGRAVPRSPFAAPVPPALLAPPIVRPPQVAKGPENAPARKESISELIAFGLVAAGAFIGIASLFLPWSGVTGIGIGTMSIAGSPPSPNQWGWAMPASMLLFLVSVPVLAAAAASDRGQERYPRFGSVIGRVTDLVLPMILGGMYLGVVLMYLTVPADYGPGLYLGQYVLGLGAVLLIAGAVVTAFLPPRVEDHPD